MTADNTVLVSGALGQVGKRCVEILLARGMSVVATDIDTPANAKAAKQLQQSYSSDKFQVAYVDLTDRDGVFGLCRRYRPGAIIHLAAIVSPVCYAMPELAHRVNVDGTRNLVAAANVRMSKTPRQTKKTAAANASRSSIPHCENTSAMRLCTPR